MTNIELIKELRNLLPEQVDYAELVESPVPSSYGHYYVWQDPEPYIIEAAANRLEAYESIGLTPDEIKALLDDFDGVDKCDVCRNAFSNEQFYDEDDEDWFPRRYKCDSCYLGGGEQNHFEWRGVKENKNVQVERGISL